MKGKLTILLLFVCAGLFGQVPDTETFDLDTVVDVVVPTTNDLVCCFSDAIADYFDPDYEGSKDRLSNFRNYGDFEECDAESEYSGGEKYPEIVNYSLGSNTGTVNFDFEPQDIPDRFIVYYDENVVIETGYWGDSSKYDYEGLYRSYFKDALEGRTDPITGTTYPDFTNFPDDGYPRVTDGYSSSDSFTKSSATPTNATVEVYAPMSGTAWSFTLYCPE